MKLIVGLGNPGKEYEATRHNVGFMAIDFLAEKLNAPKFKFNKKFNAEVSEVKAGREKTILAKPQTFMNNSGESVFTLLNFYKIKPANITVIHDDLDLELGDLREAFDRGSAGHNGVQSIINILGTKEFNRFRVGIGRHEKIPGDAYVLQKFKPTELKKIKEVFEKLL